jgi:hypothetical protein
LTPAYILHTVETNRLSHDRGRKSSDRPRLAPSRRSGSLYLVLGIFPLLRCHRNVKSKFGRNYRYMLVNKEFLCHNQRHKQDSLSILLSLSPSNSHKHLFKMMSSSFHAQAFNLARRNTVRNENDLLRKLGRSWIVSVTKEMFRRIS